MKQEKFLKAVKTVTKALNNKENLFFTYRTVIAKTFIDCFKSYKEQAKLIAIPDDEQLDYIANNAATRFLNMWIKGQMVEHLKEEMFDAVSQSHVQNNVGLAAYQLLDFFRINNRDIPKQRNKMIEDFFKKYPAYVDAIHTEKSTENKKDFILTLSREFPLNEIGVYDCKLVETEELKKLNKDDLDLSDDLLVNAYLNHKEWAKRPYYAEHLEEFSKFIQFAPPSFLKNFFEQNQAQKNEQNPLSELANSQRVTIQEQTELIKSLQTEVELQDETRTELTKELEQHKDTFGKFKWKIAECLNAIDSVKRGKSLEELENTVDSLINEIQLYDNKYNKNEEKESCNKIKPHACEQEQPLKANKGGLRMEMNDYATAAFEEKMQASGINVYLVACYTSSSGLRLANYKADGVKHMSISHVDRMPTWEEIWQLRDDFGPINAQMAHVMEYNKRPQDNTITLIELFYK